MQAALFVALCGVAFLLGVIGHELTHWAVWRLLGRDAELVSLTAVEIQQARLDWRDSVAAVAPVGVGVVIGAGGVVLGVLLAVPLAVGLVVYTSRQDLSVARGGLSGGR